MLWEPVLLLTEVREHRCRAVLPVLLRRLQLLTPRVGTGRQRAVPRWRDHRRLSAMPGQRRFR